MGQLATTIAGGIGGFLIGGPMGAQMGMMLGGMVGQSLFGPTVKGPRLNDLKVSASTLGAAIPEIYGTVRIGGNMIWSSGIKETEKTERAGKGGPKQTTYTYSASFAVALCKGPVDGVLRVWADGKIVYDGSAGATRVPGVIGAILSNITDDSPQFTGFGTNDASIGKRKRDSGRVRLYKGTEEQLPDALIEADKGSGNVSAHRGLAYVVFEDLQLEDFGNRIPQFTFEVSRAINNSFTSITVDGSDPVAGTARNRVWIPDWELGRLLSWTEGNAAEQGTDILDLNSMETVFSIDQSLRGGTRARYIPGTGILYREEGSSNSRPMGIWDTFTLTRIGQLGNSSNSLSGFYLDNCGHPFGAYGALGEVGYGYANNGVRHEIFVGWTRTVWAFKAGSQQPLFNATAAFEPAFMFPGRTTLGTSEIIGWRNANLRLELEIFRIGAGAQSQLKDAPVPSNCTGPSYTWEQSDDYSQETLYLNPVAGQNYTASVVLFDPTDNCIFTMGSAGGTPTAAKYSIETGEWKFVTQEAGMVLPISQMNYSRLYGGSFGFYHQLQGQNATLMEISLQDGSITRNVPYDDSWGDPVNVGQGQHWDDVSSSLILETEFDYRRVYFRTGISQLKLADVVADICVRTNVLEEGDFDVSGLNEDPITGYLIDRETTARDVLRQLATGFLFDGYESDYLLKFRSRGGESQVTIPEDWISRDGSMDVIKDTITQELEMPMRITVNYYDIARDHQQGSQTAKRLSGPLPTMLSSKEDIIDLPITWTPDEGKQIAEKILMMAWSNRESYQFTLPWRYLKYDPSDVVTVALDNGTTYLMRLNETLVGADFTMDIKAQSEKPAAYVSQASGVWSAIPLQSIGLTYPATPLVMNTPLLRDLDYDSDNAAVCYLSVGTNALRFTGAALLVNDGFDYGVLGAITSKVASGYVQQPLPPTKAYGSTDNDSVLIVRLSDASFTLESITQEDMLNTYANAALVGDEVIQFRDAELQSNGVWHLTGILRARRGTNYAVNSHIGGERFVLLDPAKMLAYSRAPQEYVVTRDFKAVPTGGYAEDAVAYTHNLIPRDLQPYTPEDIAITDDDALVTVSMSRRSRVTAPLVDGTGDIHYKEGEKASAKIVYKVWVGKGFDEIDTAIDPDELGSIALFAPDGSELPSEFTFPLSLLGGETSVLIRLTEMGVVEGIPKWITAERVGIDLWNIVEFY